MYVMQFMWNIPTMRVTCKNPRTKYNISQHTIDKADSTDSISLVGEKFQFAILVVANYSTKRQDSLPHGLPSIPREDLSTRFRSRAVEN